jgi:transposase
MPCLQESVFILTSNLGDSIELMHAEAIIVRFANRLQPELGHLFFPLCVNMRWLFAITCETERRLERLTEQLRHLAPTWRWAPVVDAVQALRGVSFVTAVSLVAELGDLTRFRSPRELMAYLGLVPSEYSSGPTMRRGAITKAGNPHVRRLLAEAAWAPWQPAA